MGSLRCVILCIVIFSTVKAQVFHVVAPNTFRLDSDETIAITLDGKDSALVNVYIQDFPGKIKNITQTLLEVHPGQPEIFKVHLNAAEFPPTFLSNPNSEKLVTLNVHAQNFQKAIQIPISNHAGYVFIQTDKPIYTPQQNAHIRIIPLNEDAIPSDKPFKLQIKNPKNVIVEETTFNRNQKFQKPFVTHQFKFPTYPVLGEWSVTVNYGYELQENTTVRFELQEYVLPTFTVELKTPDVILETDTELSISVDAKYVYGKKVQGMVTFRLGVKGEAPRTTYFAVIGPKELRDGKYRQVVKAKDFEHHKNIGWFPEIEGSHLVVEATVMDAASGNKEVATDAKCRFSKSPFVISFHRCLQDFKPGLVSVFEADINYVDGKPAAGITTKITAVTEKGPLNVAHHISSSDAEGKVAFELHPEIHHKSIAITLETTDKKYEGNQAIGHFEQHRFESKNNAFIALERSSSHKTKIGEMFVKLVHIEPAAMSDIYYAVISRGKIVGMKKLPQGRFKIQRVEFLLQHDMVPSFRLVVWAHYRNELLADSLNIDVEDACNPDAKVDITPVFNTKEPGNDGKIIISGTKDTLVGLLGVDEAVYALSKKDLLTKSKMFQTMSKHDLGCGPGGGTTTDEVLTKAGIVLLTTTFSPSPNAHSSCVAIKRKKRSVASEKLSSYSGLDKECCALGMSHDRFNRNCEKRTNIVVHFLNGEHRNCSKAFLECCLHAKDNGFTEMKLRSRSGMVSARMGGVNFEEPNFIPIEEEEFWEKGTTVRSYFREIWFITDKIVGPDNKEELRASLPHSITTWVIQAVSVSPTSGMCVAEPQKIVSFKKVFLQLNLPYSVVRNEQIEIQAIVFNYGPTRLNVVVYMYGVKDLCTGANEGEKSERKRLSIEANSAGSVTFPVIPLKSGTFDIKVVALSPDGSDVILRKLTVVPEGYLHEKDITIKLDPSNQQKRKRRHISTDTYSDSIDPSQNMQVTAIKLPVPQDFVPGTESCVITALGDQFGPVIETSLNNPDQLLLKPRGCGEQNMMFFAPTLYTMKYLKVKGKISPEIEEKGYAFIREGYGNQLAFRKDDGSYAAYQSKPTSTWLTAFVAKVFCQANEIVHIDENVMCSAVKWLINHQQEDGSFVEGSPVYHIDMMGGVQGKTPLTAFTLISLEECQCDPQNLLLTKKRALAYLEEHLGDVNEPLPVAIMAYALSLSDSILKTVANDKLLSMAKYDEDRNMMHWGVGDSAKDIEATSYALLNQLQHNDMIKGNSIVNWLSSQQLQSGSFKSTQDTVVGLQALSEYAIRAQMPAMNLVANISSSNDRNFHEVLNFHPENAHVLQDVKVNKIGGMLFVNTAGHGVGVLSVKLRYNLLKTEDKVCRFDVTVNATEVKEDRIALGVRIDAPIRNNPDRLPPDLIRGVENALKVEPDLPVLEIDPRSRQQKASLVAAPIPDKVARSLRVRRQNGHENSKLVLKISVCAKYLGNKSAEMSIVDVGIFSGFVPNEEDLKELQDDPEHLIERYEKSSKGIVFYLEKVPSKEKYCFDFHVTREFIVGNTQTSVVKVYDYYNPDETCTVFYSPGSNSPILHTLCENGICQCAEGGCPPKNPFDAIKDIKDDTVKREKLRDIACDNYDFVWLGKLKDRIKKENGFYNISFEIDEVVKEGIEKANLIQGETRTFLARDNCESAYLFNGQTYLIMGRDGEKYKDEKGEIWHRYLLDKTSVVHMWTSIKNAKDKVLQRTLMAVKKKLKNAGCAL